MAITSCRGIVRGGTIVLTDKSTILAEGTEVIITPLGKPGTSAAVVAAVEAPPHVPAEWVDELEQLIGEGRRPPTYPHLFEEEP